MTTTPRVEPLVTLPSDERPKPAAAFRGDLQGLRAVAVVVVLLYHTGLGPSGGFIGVDVFFVLSGFLITGLLVREHDRTGRISLPKFWARRLRRLLPASALVVLFTLVATRAYLPASRWPSVGQDAVAAAGYFLNWRLAAQSVDYLSEGSFASPLQHFWSLAIEEQFYLVWPLLISLVLLARSRKVAVAVIGAVIAGSLARALLTYSPQTYFTTDTRVWELAAGALCAVAFASRPLDLTKPGFEARLAPLLGWTGLGLVLVALFVVRPATMWPGPLTVLVVVGTMLVLRYGEARYGARLVLARPPVRWIGDISYSLYLWHWPLVVIAEVDGPLTTAEGWSIVAISIVLAALTYYLVEGPARKAKFWAPSPLGIAGGLALALVVAGSGSYLSHAQSVQVPVNAPGAAAGIAVQASATEVAPSLEQAKKDTGEIYARGCPSNYSDASVRPCVFDHRAGPGDPTVVAVGDSKVGQWIPALQKIAQERHWQLISMTKAGCPFSDIRRLNGTVEYTSCEQWNQAVLAKVRELRPTLLVTTQLQYYPAIGADGKPIADSTANHDELIRGLTARLNEIKAMGQPVVTITETPRMGTDMPDCVSLHLKDLAICARGRDAALHGLIVPSAAKATDTPTVDLNDWLCTVDRCPAVIGNVLVYRDDHHLTATYARTLAPFLEDRLALALPSTLVQSLRLSAAPTPTPTATQSTEAQESPGATP
jgi:peptidoglycan/LPS O-acetylase OafA/YrhL